MRSEKMSEIGNKNKKKKLELRIKKKKRKNPKNKKTKNKMSGVKCCKENPVKKI